MGSSIYWAADEADIQFTILDLSASKKQCLIFFYLSQYEIAGKRIDLVVEGGQARLAVECDGDNWHGADHYEADMQRQRQLERCGWEFFRVRESAFYSDKNASLQQLWIVLEEKGIFPRSSYSKSNGTNNKGWENNEYTQAFKESGNDRADEADFRTYSDDSPGKGENASETGNRRVEEFTTMEIQNAIVNALAKCPNRSCTVHSMTSRVLKEVGIIIRGNRRKIFGRRLIRILNMLEEQGVIEKYKAKNHRIRLIKEII